MKVNKKTPRTEMVYDSLLDKMIEIHDDLAKETGLSVEAIDKQLSQYAALSARVEFDKGEVDFPLASIGDTPAEVKAKFLKYADTGTFDIAEKAFVEIVRVDYPAVPVYAAPDALPDDTEKK